VAYFLGIDGGGSKTACLVGDGQSVLGRGMSGGSNVVRAGEAQAREALYEAIGAACRDAGITPAKINQACAGVAGAGRPEVRERIHSLLAGVLRCELEIVGDMEIALEAAFGSGPGVVVIAGTGSIAYGRTSEGETARAGGWGFAVSDEGSGQWIGRMAAGAALRSFDQGESTFLLEQLAQAWGLSSREQLVLAVNATPAPDFAGWLPMVLKVADSGDEVARSVLARAGRELAELARLVIGRLFASTVRVPVAMSGGVFSHSSMVREVFYNELHAARPDMVLKQEVVDPVEGALARARRR
jgi:N-acetylglucosamine kinase-like BadF-type ATPase